MDVPETEFLTVDLFMLVHFDTINIYISSVLEYLNALIVIHI